MFYKKINKYKYQLLYREICDSKIQFKRYFKHEFFAIFPSGILIIERLYAWNGVSGFFDFEPLKYPSLVHDCLYQLIRMGILDREVKKEADLLFKRLVEEAASNMQNPIKKYIYYKLAILLYLGLLAFGWVGLLRREG